TRPPHPTTPSPYTTLFRSLLGTGHGREGDLRGLLVEQLGLGLAELHRLAAALGVHDQEPEQPDEQQQRKVSSSEDHQELLAISRSEEHTSELQSRCEIVGR